ncbi:hypothetical protein L596_005707 [Steinernema carpocapsae]|uniref:Uncharacterized protein n=1 Tax=Steinernema carpocapsae TaxID=34508 RepID=A0A4U8V149_STECR|nr:hypothetical protein L596_005707 [Steinernema carpocapsae]
MSIPNNRRMCDRQCKADDLLLRLSSDDGFMDAMFRRPELLQQMFAVVRDIQDKRIATMKEKTDQEKMEEKKNKEEKKEEEKKEEEKKEEVRKEEEKKEEEKKDEEKKDDDGGFFTYEGLDLDDYWR